jgi:integrase
LIDALSEEVRFAVRRCSRSLRAVGAINNSGWKTARKKAGLSQVRVHDLKQTFGRRLRAANVPLETRKVLLGHRNGDITTHYSAPELEELLVAVNKVCEEKSGKSPALVVLRHRAVS